MTSLSRDGGDAVVHEKQQLQQSLNEHAGRSALVASPDLRFWVRAACKLIIVVWASATLAFAVLHLTPGTYADQLIDNMAQFSITAERKAELIAFYGFDKPLWQQYLLYISAVFQGDLGTSYAQSQPVTSVIASQLMPTLILAACSIVLALLLAVLIAVATVESDKFGRMVSSVFEVAVVSIPNFWLGIILLTVFSFNLRWFPSAGANGFMALVLPTLTLAVPMAGTFIQVLRPELERETAAPYFITARARGRSRTGAIIRHALPHAFLPLLTLSGTYFAYLIGGTVIVENLFGRPGLGRITLNAVLNKDVPLVAGIVILSAAAFVLVNLLVDLVIHRIDPRIGAER